MTKISKKWQGRLVGTLLALVVVSSAGVVYAAYYGFSGGVPGFFSAFRANSNPVASMTVTGAQYMASYQPTGTGPWIHPLCEAAANSAGLAAGTQTYYCVIKMQAAPLMTSGGCPPIFGAGCGSGPGVTIGIGGGSAVGPVNAKIFTVQPTTIMWPSASSATGVNDCNPAEVIPGNAYQNYCGIATAPADPQLAGSCAAAPANAETSTSPNVTWTASASGGNGSYTYSWTGTQGLTGTAASIVKGYLRASGYVGTGGTSVPDPDSATVTITSGSQSITRSCTVDICAKNGEKVEDLADTPPYPNFQTIVADSRCCSNTAITGSATYKYDRVCVAGGTLLRPDLTSGAPSSPGFDNASIWPVASVASTWSALITNSGTAGTGAVFNNRWQFDNDTDHSSVSHQAVDPVQSPILAPNATDTTSYSYTFPAAGTWYVRDCADQNAGGTGTIGESNETNNCSNGDWLTVPVVPPAPTNPAGSCSAGVVSLSWTASPGANGYYVRVQKPASEACPSGWVVAGWDGNTCVPNGDNVTGTSVTYNGTLGSTYAWWVHARLTGGQWGPAIGGPNVTCPAAQPDMTAGAITPTTATEDSARSFLAVVTNDGVGLANAHTTLFQRATSAGGAGATDIGTFATGAVAANGGTRNASISYTFTSPGTWYLRACADKSSAGDVNGVLAESDENDNCGPWTAITVAAAVQPVPVANLSNNGPITYNSPATLTYTCTNSTSATISTFGAVTPVSGGTRTTPSLTNTTNYQLTCTGPGGSNSDTTTVTVTNPTITVSAEPDRVKAGDSVTITWESDQCTNVVVTRNGAQISTGVLDNTVGLTAANITGQTTFRAVCNGAIAEDTVIVNIIPKFEEF